YDPGNEQDERDHGHEQAVQRQELAVVGDRDLVGLRRLGLEQEGEVAALGLPPHQQQQGRDDRENPRDAAVTLPLGRGRLERGGVGHLRHGAGGSVAHAFHPFASTAPPPSVEWIRNTARTSAGAATNNTIIACRTVVRSSGLPVDACIWRPPVVRAPTRMAARTVPLGVARPSSETVIASKPSDPAIPSVSESP